MKLTKLLIIISIFVSCADAYGATFNGKVIDADTKKTIEGAVVVATWHEERATPTGPSSRFKDVKEALTDENGSWVIKGPKGRELGNILSIFSFLTGMHFTNPPEFIVFKPEFCSWPEGFSIEACKGRIKPEGNLKIREGEIVELPKLTSRKDRIRAQGILIPLMDGDKATHKKIINFIRLLNQERRYLGIPEDPILKEIENEE